MECEDCGLRYDVIFNNDGQGDAGNYCPRCGSEDVKLDDTQKPVA